MTTPPVPEPTDDADPGELHDAFLSWLLGALAVGCADYDPDDIYGATEAVWMLSLARLGMSPDRIEELVERRPVRWVAAKRDENGDLVLSIGFDDDEPEGDVRVCVRFEEDDRG